MFRSRCCHSYVKHHLLHIISKAIALLVKVSSKEKNIINFELDIRSNPVKGEKNIINFEFDIRSNPVKGEKYYKF